MTIFIAFTSLVKSVGLPLASKHPDSKKISEIDCLFIFVLYVASKKSTSSKIRAFCLVLSN